MLVMKYMAEFGWQPIVINISENDSATQAEDWHGVRVFRCRPRTARWRLAQIASRIRRTHHWGPLRPVVSRALMPVAATISFPDSYAAARRDVLRLSESLHDNHGYDAVLSLYHPLSAHLVAKQIGATQRIPWIALTKDFYSWPNELVYGRAQSLLNSLKRRVEVKALRGASALLTISDYMSDYMRQFLSDVLIDTLPHCYDPAGFNSGSDVPASDGVFRLVSVGRTLKEHDSDGLSMLFRAVRQLQAVGDIAPDWFRIRFVGSGGELAREQGRQCDCEPFIETVPPRSHAEAMQQLSNATCLFYIQTPFGTRRRLTEYLGSRRPILAFPEFKGTMSNDLIQEYGAGRIAADTESLKNSIRALISRFHSYPRLDLPINGAVVLRHSARQRAGELAALLEQIMRAGATTSEAQRTSTTPEASAVRSTPLIQNSMPSPRSTNSTAR